MEVRYVPAHGKGNADIADNRGTVRIISIGIVENQHGKDEPLTTEASCVSSFSHRSQRHSSYLLGMLFGAPGTIPVVP